MIWESGQPARLTRFHFHNNHPPRPTRDYSVDPVQSGGQSELDLELSGVGYGKPEQSGNPSFATAYSGNQSETRVQEAKLAVIIVR